MAYLHAPDMRAYKLLFNSNSDDYIPASPTLAFGTLARAETTCRYCRFIAETAAIPRRNRRRAAFEECEVIDTCVARGVAPTGVTIGIHGTTPPSTTAKSVAVAE